jgi:hypothetical protein
MSMNSESTNTVRYPGPSSTDAPGRAIEPWFAILLSALVPLVGALFVPISFRLPMYVVGGALCIWGLVLLVRHELEVRRQRNVTHD